MLYEHEKQAIADFRKASRDYEKWYDAKNNMRKAGLRSAGAEINYAACEGAAIMEKIRRNELSDYDLVSMRAGAMMGGKHTKKDVKRMLAAPGAGKDARIGLMQLRKDIMDKYKKNKTAANACIGYMAIQGKVISPPPSRHYVLSKTDSGQFKRS
jgi:hypothetical protein